MTERYRQLSGFEPENESDIMLRLRVLAGELYHQRAYAEFIRRQLFPSAATGEYLDCHAAQRGLSRKAGTKAIGEVVFTAAESIHDDIVVPAGTVVCTPDEGCRFITDEDAVIGTFRSMVAVQATAAQVGASYNVNAGTISVIVTPVMGVGSVTNTEVFYGGSDDESDDALRERIVNSYREISNGTNAAYYRATAMAMDGVYSASVVGEGRGAGTVDVYVCGQGTPLDENTIARLQTQFDKARELNVDVLVQSPTAVSINLYIFLSAEQGYDMTALSTAVGNSVSDYISSLGIGQDVLLSRVGDVIHHIEGVADYRFQESYGGNREIADSEYAVAGSIVVRSLT